MNNGAGQAFPPAERPVQGGADIGHAVTPPPPSPVPRGIPSFNRLCNPTRYSINDETLSCDRFHPLVDTLRDWPGLFVRAASHVGPLVEAERFCLRWRVCLDRAGILPGDQR